MDAMVDSTEVVEVETVLSFLRVSEQRLCQKQQMERVGKTEEND